MRIRPLLKSGWKMFVFARFVRNTEWPEKKWTLKPQTKESLLFGQSVDIVIFCVENFNSRAKILPPFYNRYQKFTTSETF